MQHQTLQLLVYDNTFLNAANTTVKQIDELSVTDNKCTSRNNTVVYDEHRLITRNV